jgi:hypothetical protein
MNKEQKQIKRNTMHNASVATKEERKKRHGSM